MLEIYQLYLTFQPLDPQVILFDKHSFLDQLTQIMTKDCSFNNEFSTSCVHQAVLNVKKKRFDINTQHVPILYFSCTEQVTQWTISCHILG